MSASKGQFICSYDSSDAFVIVQHKINNDISAYAPNVNVYKTQIVT